MIIKLNKWQLSALGVFAASYVVQTWGGWRLLKVNDQLIEANELLSENGNRGAYLSMYLLVKLIENDVEFSEFDQQVMNNPPKLVDADNPNLFAEFLERCDEHGYDEDKAREFLNQLKQVREED